MTKKNKTQRTPSSYDKLKNDLAFYNNILNMTLINQFYIILNIVRLRTKDMHIYFLLNLKISHQT